MLASAMVAIAVVSIGLLVVILPEGLDQKPSTFRIEVGKALLQLGIVGVVGAALSFFASNYQRNAQLLDKARDIAREEKRAELERQSEDDRERIEYVDKLHSSILSSALDAYCEIKKIRRLMRARAIRVVSEEKHILAAPLDGKRPAKSY